MLQVHEMHKMDEMHLVSRWITLPNVPRPSTAQVVADLWGFHFLNPPQGSPWLPGWGHPEGWRVHPNVFNAFNTLSSHHVRNVGMSPAGSLSFSSPYCRVIFGFAIGVCQFARSRVTSPMPREPSTWQDAKKPCCFAIQNCLTYHDLSIHIYRSIMKAITWYYTIPTFPNLGSCYWCYWYLAERVKLTGILCPGCRTSHGGRPQCDHFGMPIGDGWGLDSDRYHYLDGLIPKQLGFSLAFAHTVLSHF